jgi:xylanolytic transcriptional activator XlnR
MIETATTGTEPWVRSLKLSLKQTRADQSSGGCLLKEEIFRSSSLRMRFDETMSTDEPPCQTIDDLLTLILITIVVSGGDFKPDCFIWLNKSLNLSTSMGLNRTDGVCSEADGSCMNNLCACRSRSNHASSTLAEIEALEERRRVFWLLFSLDRHLALSFNGNLFIHDDEVHVYDPLPEDIWENLDTVPFEILARRTFGPPTVVSGVGFFEYFTPLMTLLGDVIETHRRSSHPRLGTIDDTAAVTMIETSLEICARSIDDLSALHDVEKYSNGTQQIPANYMGNPVMTPSTNYSPSDQDPFSASSTHFPQPRKPRRGQVLLVTSYARFIVNVLHVLLQGKWDAVSMLSPDTPPTSPSQAHDPSSMGISNWITSVEFMKCASHAILASEAVETILSADPELTFMPYLLGIYLLHGSFILLLFADRMPQVGQNESVERACETIIRAHEVCVVTLSTEFQKRFRKVLRATLYEVRKNINGEGIDAAAGEGINGVHRRDSALETEEVKARRSALSLYRWTRGSRGLAL